MVTTQPNYPTTKRFMLSSMVEADIVSFRNLLFESRVQELVDTIEAAVKGTPYHLGGIIVKYAEFVTYCEGLTFKWKGTPPPDYTNLEVWWSMVAKGQKADECYIYYVNNISNPVTMAWYEVMNNVHKIYVPPRERDNTSDEAVIQNDPN